MNNEMTLHYLSHDRAFGMMTRNAFEIFLSQLSRDFCLYVMDLNDIHKLNAKHGYLTVNEKVRRAVAGAQIYVDGLQFGRVFSGDEISIVDWIGHQDLMEIIREFFQEEQIGFKYLYKPMNHGETLDHYSYELDQLSNLLRDSNYYHAL